MSEKVSELFASESWLPHVQGSDTDSLIRVFEVFQYMLATTLSAVSTSSVAKDQCLRALLSSPCGVAEVASLSDFQTLRVLSKSSQGFQCVSPLSLIVGHARTSRVR